MTFRRHCQQSALLRYFFLFLRLSSSGPFPSGPKPPSQSLAKGRKSGRLGERSDERAVGPKFVIHFANERRLRRATGSAVRHHPNHILGVRSGTRARIGSQWCVLIRTRFSSRWFVDCLITGPAEPSRHRRLVSGATLEHGPQFRRPPALPPVTPPSLFV